MASIPKSLEAHQCPILKGERYAERLEPVLKSYNQTVDQARRLHGLNPEAFEEPGLADSLDRLRRVHDELITPRFKVGFLGPYGCGKSSVVNNMLGMKICGIGSGVATTSVITRFVIDPKQASPALKIRYFSLDEYRHRRNTLCEWARLPSLAGRDESKLLEMLRDHHPRASITSARPVKPGDLPYLRVLLESFERFASNLVLETAHEEPELIDDKKKLFENRKDVLNHKFEPGTTNPVSSQYLLLSEAEITFFPQKKVPPELEIVDCPGLASTRSVDDLLTKEYIPRLNGAIVFVKADEPSGPVLSEIFDDLKSKFGDSLKSRVWVVVNKMDNPDRESKLEGDTNGKTTFDHIAELETIRGFPLTQVFFACKEIFELLVGETRVADRKDAMAKLKLDKLGDEEAIQTVLDKTPALKPAFEAMLKDGGYSRILDLIQEEIGTSVAAEILSQARVDCQRAGADIQYALNEAQKPVDEQEIAASRAWSNRLMILLSELTGDQPGGRGELFTKLEEYGRGVRTQLEAKFRSLNEDAALNAMSIPELLEHFALDAGQLQNEIDSATATFVNKAYLEATTRLDAPALKPIKLAADKEPMVLWGEIRQQDRDGGPWRARLRPNMIDQGLIRELGLPGIDELDGKSYKLLMLEKLRTASQQIALAVRAQMRRRIEELRRQVTLKLRPRSAVPASAIPGDIDAVAGR